MTRQFEFINDEVNVLLKSQEDTILNIRGYIIEEKMKTTKREKNQNPSLSNIWISFIFSKS